MIRWSAVLLTAAPAVGLAQSPDTQAAQFGARENVQQISLSPDGTHVAMIVPKDARGTVVYVVDVVAGGTPKAILTSGPDPQRLTSCHWSTDTRLVCGMYAVERDGDLIGYTRMFSLNRDGSDLKMMSARPNARSLGVAQSGGGIIDWVADGAPGSVLATRVFVPENSTGTHVASSAEGLGVERIDTATLRRTAVSPARPSAIEYITDGKGVVRIMGAWANKTRQGTGDTINYHYTMGQDRDWKPLGKVVLTPAGSIGFEPYAVDSALNVAYGFDGKDGRSALYRMALDGTSKRELVVSRPDVDVDQLLRIGRQRRVVGVSYMTERRDSEFFDPELKRLRQGLIKALPGAPLITFVDASADEKKLLLFAGSDTDPGSYYIYDKSNRRLSPLLPARVELADVKLSTVKPVSYPAADGTMIPAYLTLPPGSEGKGLPAIVMPHGGPSARDEWGFDWLSQYFAARGFAVLQPNFRGSAGYGAQWFQKNGFQSWPTAIGDVTDAGRWLVAQGIGRADRLAIVGWSYGGYAALQSAVVAPDLFKAVVAIAPVTDLDVLRQESQRFTNFQLVDQFIGRGPHVAAGSPARHAAKIKAPVLMFHGDMDQNVGVGESRLMAERLRDAGRKVDYVEFKGLAHQLDDATARPQLLGRTDVFLRQALGM